MKQTQASKASADKTSIGWAVIVVGAFAGLMLLVAGILLFVHGQNLVDLRSVASQTGDQSIMEVYYNEMGSCNQAYGVAAIGLGAGIVAMSLGLGASFMRKSDFRILNNFMPLGK
ncbi:MAG: hypothetical protein JW753_05590 [Dehalococcoidia bacterium]|nr:hypothetical protein [Dehalococcoidia bacterium]